MGLGGEGGGAGDPEVLGVRSVLSDMVAHVGTSKPEVVGWQGGREGELVVVLVDKVVIEFWEVGSTGSGGGGAGGELRWRHLRVEVVEEWL